MPRIGIIREGKTPSDSRVAFSPLQCKWLMNHFPKLEILVQPSAHRCYSDDEYAIQGLQLSEDMDKCDILFGIKEVPSKYLIPNKTYLFFSHTRKRSEERRVGIGCRSL